MSETASAPRPRSPLLREFRDWTDDASEVVKRRRKIVGSSAAILGALVAVVWFRRLKAGKA